MRDWLQVQPQPTRRGFLHGAAATVGLVVGFPALTANASSPMDHVLAANGYVRVAPDNSVTVLITHVELGQGTHTGLSAIVADELDADWSQIHIEAAPVDNALYGVQLTGGSASVRTSWEPLRRAGATARAMLVRAATINWGVPAAEVTVEKGVVYHKASKRQSTFGALAAMASILPVPDKVTLKDPKDFTLIGRSLPRLDTPAKINGSAIYALDTVRPNMVVAVIARPPLFGATMKSFDATAAKAVAGVLDVFDVPAGVAVVAKGFWAASQGRDALKIEWDDSAAEKRGTDAIMASYEDLAGKPGTPSTRKGDVDQALAGAAKHVTATYKFPYLAHAPMEPLNCVVELGADHLDIWSGDQAPTFDQANAATAAGLQPAQVKIHTLYAGGSFGRRATLTADYIVEAVSVAKVLRAKSQDKAPAVKLIWTREDDIRGGRYRPMYLHAVDVGLDAKGELIGWRHRIVGQSIMTGTSFAKMMVKDGIDATSVEGVSDTPYAIPNFALDLATTTTGVPVLWWRSVGSTHTAFVMETMLDEIAAASGADPVALRRSLLKESPRHLGVLELVAAKANWGTPLAKGRGRGIAVHQSFGTYVAQVAEITVDAKGKVKVDRVVCAVDCGVPVSPDIIAAQMEGGIGFGLGAILYGAITLKDGVVEQSNFDGYQVLRMEDMPVVEVHIVPSQEPPTGVGEPGVPPIGPAVANAIFAATGKRHRVLPLAVGTSA